MQDIKPNDTEQNCLKNIKYKLGGNLNLSKENVSRASAAGITAGRIGSGEASRDFMQCALMSNNKNNVLLLSDFFDLVKYRDYLKTLSLDIQENMSDLFQKRVLELSGSPGMRK